MRRIAVLDAPSNLGLRPPTATSVPGCAKAPGALRDNGLLTRLGARDAGCLTPPRYDPGDWRPGDGVAQAAQIAEYSRRLADRIGGILDAGEFPVILGGDCSILLGSGLAMHRLGEAVGGRIGLVFVDGHSDFRHPGNASYVGAAAGEDLALVTGRGQPDLASIEGRRPYFRDVDVVVMGLRAQDEYRLDLQAAGIVTRPVPALRAEGAARSAQWAREQLVDCAGFWLHVDVDVLDPAVMPAVDAPSPGGIAFPELEILLAGLVESPHCLGVEITVFDPDYDPDGLYAAEIAGTVAAGLAAARTVTPRPDLIAARADLAAPRGAAAPTAATAPSDEPASTTGSPVAPTADAAPSATPAAPSMAPTKAPLAAPAAAPSSKPPTDNEPPTIETPETLAEQEPEAEAEATPDVDATPEAEATLEADATPEAEITPGPEAEIAVLPESGGVAEDEAGADVEAADEVELAVEVEATADKPETEAPKAAAEPISFVTRPLGQAPLLDSKPLPATRPGMLRPRAAEVRPAEVRPAEARTAEVRAAEARTGEARAAEELPAEDLPAADGFSLPAQRPAFDLGSGSPADIA